MSGINFDYEIATSGDEIKYYENTSLIKKDKQNLASIIAGEIVNEILENALDIASCATQTGIDWREIKGSESNTAISSNDISDFHNIEHIKNLSDKDCDLHITEESINIAGDIFHNEVRNSINAYGIMDNFSQQGNQGIGDQPKDEKYQCRAEEYVEPEISRTVEKKTRVTDLVKNAPQLINEYLRMDENSRSNQDEWEEAEESLVQVIELDHVKPGEEKFLVKHEHSPEDIALPDEDDEPDEILTIPSDDKMDIIDLSSNAFKEEEKLLSSEVCNNSSGAKGDDAILICPRRISSPISITNDISDGAQKSDTQLSDEDRTCGSKMKKKKWNFGTRLWGFIKKGNKQQHQQVSSNSEQ